MSLKGGDPEAMTLSQFLDAAYALLVDEYRRLGASLTDALERTREYSAGFRPGTAGGKETERTKPALVPEIENHEAQNEMALVQLEAMMSGVGSLGR